MKENKLFSIGEFSKGTGISIRNLRYYDEIGLLVPEKHPTSGHRIYNYEDILTLQKILSLKFLGYSLDQITKLLHKPSFTVDLNETLSLQLKALKEEKDQIEKSINVIKRVINLLKEEGEVDSNLLFNLINGLPTEHMQKKWMERHMLKDVVEGLSKKSVEETITLDKAFVQMSKKVKHLYGKSIDDPEVQEIIEQYMEVAISYLGEDLIQKLAVANVEELDLQELENMTPTPFTEDEQKWLYQAMEYYLKHSEMK